MTVLLLYNSITIITVVLYIVVACRRARSRACARAYVRARVYICAYNNTIKRAGADAPTFYSFFSSISPRKNYIKSETILSIYKCHKKQNKNL